MQNVGVMTNSRRGKTKEIEVKANRRSCGHSCPQHCSKKLSKLRQLAVVWAGMPTPPTVCIYPTICLIPRTAPALRAYSSIPPP